MHNISPLLLKLYFQQKKRLQIVTPIFDGESYNFLVVSMKSYFEASDWWEVVEEDYVVIFLPQSHHDANKISQEKDYKAKICLVVQNHIHQNDDSQNNKNNLGL